MSPAPTASVPGGSSARYRPAAPPRTGGTVPGAGSGMGAQVPGETLVDLLAGEPEVGQRIPVALPRGSSVLAARPGGPGVLLAQRAQGVRGRAAQRQPE